MRKSFFGILISLSIPLFLFVNVWQSQKYMVDYFDVRGLVRKQGILVQDNKKLINRVAELESPARIFNLLDTGTQLEKIGGGEIVRLEVIGLDD